VLLPPPQNVTFGNGTALIDPCFFTLNVTLNPEAMPFNQTIEDNIKFILNHNVFYKAKDCTTLTSSNDKKVSASQQLSNLQIMIKNHTVPRLIPLTIETTDESYNLTVDDN
jgi:hypothetical protein